jgi:GNAT superfamily N-acetyltransferase
MSQILIRDMQAEDEYFVSTCSHVDESEEIDASGARRRELLRGLIKRGAVVKVALLDGERVGFVHGIPIERSSWGPLGEDLVVIPCLYVAERGSRNGIGRGLIEAIERGAQDAGRLGTTVMAFRDLPGAEWFMPAAFFEHLGYRAIGEQGRYALLWRPFSNQATGPRFLEPDYAYEAVPGKVVVDLFWNGFCQTSRIEAARVRKVTVEFGDRVVLNERCAEDRDVLLSCQIPRAIYVNGAEIGWGYEAPEDGIRSAIRDALGAS